MMPQLSDAFGLTAMAVASMVGLFYYGYSPFSLVAGAAMDGSGRGRSFRSARRRSASARCCSPRATARRRASADSFRAPAASSRWSAPPTSRPRTFRASRAATLIGATQMFGMAGGSAGQFLVGPMIASGVPGARSGSAWASPGSSISVLLFVLLPPTKPTQQRDDWLKSAAARWRSVFRNPQSILCGDDRRPAVHPDDDLRHGLGRALPAGGARLRLRRGGDALGDGAARLDHRLSAARLHLRSHRPAQAGDRRRRRRAARVPRLDPLRPRGRASRRTSSASSPAWRRARRCCRTP